MIVHYDFAEPCDIIIYDTSGNGNNGAAANVTFENDSYRGSRCAVFNGESSYVNMGRSCMIQHPLTISVWCYPTNQGRIVSCTEGGGWNFEPNGNNLCMALYAGGSYSHVITTQTYESLLNAWHLITAAYDGAQMCIYVDGVLSGTTAKTGNITYNANNVVLIGAEATSSTSASSPYYAGKIADFSIYDKALSAEDVRRLYRARGRYHPDGSMSHAEFIEEDGSNYNVGPNGVVRATLFNEIITEPDGAKFIKICHHNNRAKTKLFKSTDSFANNIVYYDEDRWTAFGLINTVNHGDGYEFLVKQYQYDYTATPQKYRFVQTADPFTGTFDTTKHANITPTTLSGYNSIASNYGGFYKLNSYTFLCANNNTNGNWWGACGAWSSHGIGIPAYNGVAVAGLYEVYLRVYGDEPIKWFKNGIIYTTEIREDL